LGRHRRTGIVIIAALLLLALSGYGLYYLVPDAWRDGVGLVHAAIGVLCGVLLLWHRRASWHRPAA
jgi:hypothetical protein